MYLDMITGKLRGSTIDSHLHNAPLLSFIADNLKKKFDSTIGKIHLAAQY